jgi:hypothetical protein
MAKFGKGHKGYWLGKKKPHSKETIEKIKKSLIGHFVSEETKKKIKEKSVFQEGHTPWNKGIPCSEKTKEKISDTNKKKGIEPIKKHRGKGKNGSNWKGGITPENHLVRNSIELRLWRESVFARDNWTCQKCGDDEGGNLNAHHIKNFAYYSEIRTSISNGITFCKNCHQRFHNKYSYKENNEEQLKEFLCKIENN